MTERNRSKNVGPLANLRRLEQQLALGGVGQATRGGPAGVTGGPKPQRLPPWPHSQSEAPMRATVGPGLRTSVLGAVRAVGYRTGRSSYHRAGIPAGRGLWRGWLGIRSGVPARRVFCGRGLSGAFGLSRRARSKSGRTSL